MSTAEAKVNYRFPQFSREGMTHDEYFENERLIAINHFAEDFRGWDDEVPHYPKELKVINITSENYKSEILGADKPWIISFVKKFKS